MRYSSSQRDDTPTLCDSGGRFASGRAGRSLFPLTRGANGPIDGPGSPLRQPASPRAGWLTRAQENKKTSDTAEAASCWFGFPARYPGSTGFTPLVSW
jgi:hypothetical protein